MDKKITLQHLRSQLGLTQEAVAKQLGISRCFYTQLENGRRTPSLGVAARMASFYGVNIDDIFLTLGVASGDAEPESAG